MSTNGNRGRTTAERGYGWQHQRARTRAKRLVDAGQARCARCGRWIDPLLPWDLDHHDRDRRFYIGVSHRSCNRAASRRKHEPEPRRVAAALEFFNKKRTS
jgi:hypothetical protein